MKRETGRVVCDFLAVAHLNQGFIYAAHHFGRIRCERLTRAMDELCLCLKALGRVPNILSCG